MNLLPFTREPSFLDKTWMALRYPYDLVTRPMDALVNIPALSFLVIPAFSSYGTTVNFLFFYMTWAILIRSNDPLKVELLGTLGIRLLFYILPSLTFLFFDSAVPNLAVGIKEHGDKALPMGEAQGGSKGRWWKVTLVSLFNVLLSITLQLGTELLFTHILHIRSALKVTTAPPMPWSIVRDLLLALLLREVLTYFFHRYFLHSPRSHLTKLHASWQHSASSPFALVAHYDHPLAYLVHVFLPTYIPAVFFRLHLLTYHLYLIVVSLEETFAYSGYNILPSAIILGGIARRQERHLMGNGKGNYGCFGLVDFAMGTSLGENLMEDVVDEADEKQVGKKAKGKAKALKDKAQKKLASSDESDDDEEEEEEKPKSRARSSGRGTKKRDEDDNDEEEEDEEEEEKEKPRRKARSGGRKKSSDEAAEDEKPKRKASSAGKKGKRLMGRAKKANEDDE